ncbi:MAG TPA: helix-turn-helix transcriptional regulator [Woeseiaceae bacterium]
MTPEVMDPDRSDLHNAPMSGNLRLHERPFAHAGSLLRDWRAARRMSQLDLALEANVSPRHLSYLETGRSQPGRDLVARLADALDMPLRERNALLVAAGYAPEYRESALDTARMGPVRKAIEFIIRHQEPYPAFVMNRHWDVLMVNGALERVFYALRGGPPLHTNIMRQVFDPRDMRPFLRNWEEVAGDLIRHLHDEVAAAPTDAVAKGLLDEVLALPDVPAKWRRRDLDAAPVPLLTTVFGNGDLELRFFSTFTTFGTPHDITLDELRIECMFPADDETAALCRRLSRR